MSNKEIANFEIQDDNNTVFWQLVEYQTDKELSDWIEKYEGLEDWEKLIMMTEDLRIAKAKTNGETIDCSGKDRKVILTMKTRFEAKWVLSWRGKSYKKYLIEPTPSVSLPFRD